MIAGWDVLFCGPDEQVPTRSDCNADSLLLAALLEERQAISEVHGVLLLHPIFVATLVDMETLCRSCW